MGGLLHLAQRGGDWAGHTTVDGIVFVSAFIWNTERWSMNLLELFFELTQLETAFKSMSVTLPERVEVSRRFVELQQQSGKETVTSLKGNGMGPTTILESRRCGPGLD